MVTCPRLFPRN